MPCQRVATWHTPKTMTRFVVKNDIPMFKECQVKWFILNLKQGQELTFDHVCTCVFCRHYSCCNSTYNNWIPTQSILVQI
jgi:hypothetical protein